MKNKYILTGGPGSGKSSIINYLEIIERYKVIREAAEDYIKLRQALGVKEPWREEDFQEKIFWLQFRREADIYNKFTPVFIDRGLYDGLAYEKNPEMYANLRKLLIGKKYHKIFLIEHPGKMETNEIRREDVERALEIEKKLEEIYASVGKVIKIPFGPLDWRVKLILKNI
ncbi:hypothetical protein COV11_04070 [Candidatus Woesearchaeota archaeon CG10_big_fil_rev_8_21_14_0_10_30_7]|nr:MAG: hypothetical protein COV11_04070 [Candidatus Woesearchaeota archaeon CG10_big_fil_rev_8_21_14_0_10_30_7]